MNKFTKIKKEFSYALSLLREALDNYPSQSFLSVETISIKIESELNIWDYLKTKCKNESRCYFKSKNNSLEVLGLGELLFFEAPCELTWAKEQLKRDKNLYLMGGTSFYSLASKVDLPSNELRNERSHFFFPKVTIIKNNDDINLNISFTKSQVYNYVTKCEYITSIKKILFESSDKFALTPQVESTTFIPLKKDWDQNVNEACDLISSKSFSKLVLSRKKCLLLKNEIELLQNLNAPNNDSFTFYFSRGKNPNNEFFSMSPERLYKLEGDKLYIDAIAGTRPRGQDTASDKKLKNELLASQKELLEHNFVANEIESKMKVLCDRYVKVSCNEILKLKHVQHLVSEFEGKLNKKYDQIDLLYSLHPTSAVGGIPKTNAILAISKIEGRGRGLYAAPTGYINKNSSEFCVAIRSIYRDGKILNVYGGSGIVSGSDSISEWNETEAKMKNFDHLQLDCHAN